MMRQDKSGSGRLLSYVVLRAEARQQEAEFKQFLACALPDLVIPERIIRLDALPTCPTAKSIATPCPILKSDSAKSARSMGC